MSDQLSRIEEKIDRLLEDQSEHNGRIVKLETQAGFLKTTLAFLLSVTLLVGGWLLNKQN